MKHQTQTFAIKIFKLIKKATETTFKKIRFNLLHTFTIFFYSLFFSAWFVLFQKFSGLFLSVYLHDLNLLFVI